jgi:hypothetical protein
MTRLKLGLAVSMACGLLAMATSMADALRSIQISNPGAYEATGSNISFEEEARFLRTMCSGLTLRGELRERISKTPGAEAGTVTEGRTSGCRAFGFVSATVTIEASSGSPIRKRFNMYLGGLPIITGILYLDENVRFTIVAGGRTCRYEGRAGLLVQTDELSSNILSFLPEPKPRLRAGSTESCPSEGSLRGSMNFERRRTVTLV